ncbi:MAG: hypothetical protein J5611_00955 [Alphaproteobacteria bacterium]|nr:hypothetical protein [Alphaproteobacteria bacterium]
MKHIFGVFSALCTCAVVSSAFAVSAGTVSAGATDNARALTTTNVGGGTANTLRGNQGLINAYKTNQRNTYYMVNVPDVDTACREKINKCFNDYCGDLTVVPGKQSNRCAYATQSELYNYALLCLRNDTSVLLPNYATNTKMGAGGMNTAAHLCPSYVQQELMAYLSMANMASELAKTHSPQCVKSRQELTAAMNCHSIALAYGNETSSMLMSQLTDYCGAGVEGGSAEMVSRFANAGNVGANIWGWAEKILTLDMNKKGADWEKAVDAVLASYTNRMNLACGENMQLNTVDQTSSSTGPTALQTAAAIATGVAFPTAEKKTNASAGNVSLYMEITSRSGLYDYATANQVVNAGLTNSPLTQNAFLTSSQMDDMQTAYKKGTKVFIIRDNARCYIVPVSEAITSAETSMLAQQFSNCIYK